MELKIPENIRFIEQPSHSPDLNPAEHLWDDLRENNFHNEAFASVDQVEQALCEGLRRIEADPEGLRSMTLFPYLNITL
ncbi:MAG: transposase [Deltaproteobacteria bacterium]|nr:transposase [Deltaproteobacteria bacterium]